MKHDPKNGFEKIAISSRLDDVIKKSISKAKRDKKIRTIKLRLIKINAAIASLIIIFISSVNFVPALAESLSDVPVISSIANAVQFHYDKNIDSAVNQNLSQNISKIQKDKNISITVDNVITDDKDIFILYTLNGTMADEDIRNLLLEKFSVSDNNGKTLLNSDDFKSQRLPPKLNNKNQDSLSLSNTNYKCIISSLGNSIENYSKNKKTFGSIELISIKNMKIPDEINLKVSGITEAYNMSYSKEAYNNFTSKFNREPKNISGNWNFEIKLDKNLKSQKPEEYNNIPFSINNTDFTFKSVKIYPTHTEIRIQLGKNSIDKSQCNSIGRIVGGDTSKLPYLTDEKGNKYSISGNALVSMDSENCINLSFESPYFNKTNKLYLVINQLNYSNGEPYTNIETTKVKIK
ncbi:MAG: DUF4179 domain-containing protein [Clostridium luticellarii]|jgi:hypothetical protein|uniref:DUF4179 domain-containing protein n=1 Tax=Clostridium luticellarii TaxID=1691940 RepID=UPI002355FB12|nr:DUF4179 domain-containing protein [Clostridium luticellarii]MCI1996814.1 DUF4179 domain-containing protein [Clostridium luticellarii]MCI2041084.1 DUF4179 domain-containing protein [Clostridium luticellarii]